MVKMGRFLGLVWLDDQIRMIENTDVDIVIRHADVIQIQKHAERGGRLVCTEPVGYLRSNTTNTQYGGKRERRQKSSASNVRYRSHSIDHVSSYNRFF